jgi:hypothetical protein
MRFTEIITFTALAALVALVLGVSLQSCDDKSKAPLKEQVDPAAVTHYVGGYYLHEVHPKPGVTCFVYTTYGVSCIKE